MSIDQEIDAFIREMTVTSWTPKTARLRRWQLTQWMSYMNGRALDDAERVDVVKFMAQWEDISTRRGVMSAVRSFYQWGRDTGILEADPCRGVARLKHHRGTPRPIPDHALWASVNSAEVRVREMLLLARFAGLRCMEVGTAHTSWVAGNGLLLIPGKGGNVDPLPAHEYVADIFNSRTGYLFPSTGPGRDHVDALWVTKLCNRHIAAVAPGWTMHTLRHAFITEVYERTGDLAATQTAARHSSPETTRIYARLADARMRRVIHSLDAAFVDPDDLPMAA